MTYIGRLVRSIPPNSPSAFPLPVLAAGVAVLGIGCASVPPPLRELPTDKQAKCSIQKSQSRPLIVEWPSADRASLESQARRGLIAVHYSGCEMELLSRCRVEGKYRYTPVTLQSDQISIRDADELYAKMPIGAAKLEGELEKSGVLNVDMAIVGTYDSEASSITTAQLSGQCGKATHILTALTVGAFEFYSGAKSTTGGGASVLGFGAGAKRSRAQAVLSRSGDAKSCQVATTQDEKPPEGCGALLRVEATPITEATPAPVIAALPPKPATEPGDQGPDAAQQPSDAASSEAEPPGDPGAGEAGSEPVDSAATNEAPPEEPSNEASASALSTSGFGASENPAPSPKRERSSRMPVKRGIAREPGLIVGLHGPFVLGFGTLEEDVPITGVSAIGAGGRLDVGYRVHPVGGFIAYGDFATFKNQSTTDFCSKTSECTAATAGAGAALLLNGPGRTGAWLSLGAGYSYFKVKRGDEFSSGAVSRSTNRGYHSVGPTLRLGFDTSDSYVDAIRYGVMLSYGLRKVISASGENIEGGLATNADDAGGLAHLIVFGGSFQFDLGAELCSHPEDDRPPWGCKK